MNDPTTRDPNEAWLDQQQTAALDDPPPAEPAAPVEEPAPLPVVANLTPGLAPDVPVIPPSSEMEAIAQMAVTLAAADAVPAALRRKPNDVFLVLCTARDLGVALTTAMREFHVIEGKVTLSPKVKLAMVRSSGLGRIWADPGNDAETATWYGERRDMPGVVQASTFTMAEAMNVPARERGANIKLGEKSNWKAYPKRMLSWRALGYLLDDVFPEVGTGLYSPDELGALTNEDGEPIEVSAVESLHGMAGGRAAAAPEPEKPSEEDAAELARRLAAIRTNEDAKAELMAWWQERDLPVARNLSARQVPTVLARVNAIETKYGITAEEPADEPPSDGAPAAETPGDETVEPGEVEATFSDETTAPTAEQIAEIAELADSGDVVGWLIARAKIMNRPSIARDAKRYGVDLPDDLNAARRWWCEHQASEIASGLLAVLSASPWAAR